MKPTHLEFIKAAQVLSYDELIELGVQHRDLKHWLAFNIVTQYHSQEDAEKAYLHFMKTVVKREIPENIPVIELDNFSYDIVNLITICDSSISKTEARRLINSGGIQAEGNKVTTTDLIIELDDQPTIIKIGKRKYFDIRWKQHTKLLC